MLKVIKRVLVWDIDRQIEAKDFHWWWTHQDTHDQDRKALEQQPLSEIVKVWREWRGAA